MTRSLKTVSESAGQRRSEEAGDDPVADGTTCCHGHSAFWRVGTGEKGQGTLELWITGYGLSDADAALSWIRVRGNACQPQ